TTAGRSGRRRGQPEVRPYRLVAPAGKWLRHQDSCRSRRRPRGEQPLRSFGGIQPGGGDRMTWTSAAMARLTLAAGAALALGLYLYSSSGAAAQTQGLKSYDSNKRDFWTKPPPDWFLGDETEQQKGLAPNPGQPLPTPLADLEKTLATIKLPQGFK